MSERKFELLVTECPNCQARFRISAIQLEVGEGRVRCGACLTIFEGTQCLTWESGQEPASVQHEVSESLCDPDVEAVDETDVKNVRPVFDGLAVTDTDVSVESHCNEIGELKSIDVDSARWRSSWIGVGVVTAIIALGIQVMWYQFERWSHKPELRFIYEVICEVTACQLPAMRSLSEIVINKLVVQPSSLLEGVLIVDALILNKASYAQPFPVIELRCDGVNGDFSGARQFEPEEYLADDHKEVTGMEAMMTVNFGFEFEGPNWDAASCVMLFH